MFLHTVCIPLVALPFQRAWWDPAQRGSFPGSSFLWASFPSLILLPLPVSCCCTLSFEPPLFPSCLAFGASTCLIDFHRFQRTMTDIEIATLPTEMVHF